MRILEYDYETIKYIHVINLNFNFDDICFDFTLCFRLTALNQSQAHQSSSNMVTIAPMMVILSIIGNMRHHFDGLVKVRRNSIAYALELCLWCTNPSVYVCAYICVIYHRIHQTLAPSVSPWHDRTFICTHGLIYSAMYGRAHNNWCTLLNMYNKY